MADERAGWTITASVVKGWISRKVLMSRVTGDRMLAYVKLAIPLASAAGSKG